MVKLTYTGKPRWRESDQLYRDRKTRHLCVALQPSSLLIRLKGTRKALELPYCAAYTLAADLAGRAKLAARKTAKHPRRQVQRGRL